MMSTTTASTGKIPALSSAEHIKRLRELHRLSLAEYATCEDQYADYLGTGLSLLHMKIGIVSRIENNTYTILAIHPIDVGMSEGQTFPLVDTYCHWVMQQEQSVCIARVGADPAKATHPLYQRLRLEAYLAAPVWVENAIYGTLSFTDSAPRQQPFTKEDRELVELMALAIGRVIERDLQDQRQLETSQRMWENIQLFEKAFTYAPNGIALVATDGRWLRVNKAVSTILGYTESELLALDFQSITHPDDLTADLGLVDEVLTGKRESYRMEKRYRHRDGHIVWVLLSVALIQEDDGSPRYFISQLQDITEQKRLTDDLVKKQVQLEMMNRTLEQLASRDALTGVFNRRMFDGCLNEELHRCMRSAQPFSLMLLDIDHFKQYNDKFGHRAGDEALQRVARILQKQVRVNDRVARYGGEEFAVLSPNTNGQDAVLLAERLRQAVAELIGLERPITISIGCCTLDTVRTHPSPSISEKLIAFADQALYRAKDAGRNQVIQAEWDKVESF